MNVYLAPVDRPDRTVLYAGVTRLSIDQVTSAIVLDYKADRVIVPLADYLLVQVNNDGAVT